MPEAVIIDCVRTPVGRARRGALRNVRPDDLAAGVIGALLDRYPEVPRDEVDDVILGCSFPEAESGMNMARIAALRAGLPDIVPAVTINRFCASGLQAIAQGVDRIRAGGANIVIAGGSESMSLLPAAGHAFAPNPWFVEHRPEIYLAMGITAERLQAKYGISREAQDAFALQSHQKALKAQAAGAFRREIVPVEVVTKTVSGTGRVLFAEDEGPRADTNLEALAKLKPAFLPQGTVTAGNASQMSDGAAVSLITSERKAKQLGLTPRARLVSYAVAGVPPEIMGIGPAVAIPKALALAGLKLDRVSIIELNEAFAVQALAVIQGTGIDPDRVNVNGGAIALGHPLGCTGAKLAATLFGELERRGAQYGMVTMCVGGGQGAAGIFERI